MRLTTKGRHAIDAMIELALRRHRDTVKLAEIADRQRVSISYLELLFAKLRRGGLVSSVRGPGGGYRLARPTEAISMADIINAVDGSRIADAGVVEPPMAADGGPCRTDILWAGLAAAVHEYLKAVTLADFAEPAEFDAVGHPAAGGLAHPLSDLVGIPAIGRGVPEANRSIAP